MCRGLDEQVELFRGRPLEGAHPYLWLDAEHVKVRDHGRVVSKALVVAYAVHENRLAPASRGGGSRPGGGSAPAYACMRDAARSAMP
jgi:Transposase, Mutator family